MANHKSAVKRIKQNAKKRMNNRMKKSRARTAIKNLRLAISSNDKAKAQELLPVVQGLLGKLAKTGTIKKQNASRKTSRLASQIAAIA